MGNHIIVVNQYLLGSKWTPGILIRVQNFRLANPAKRLKGTCPVCQRDKRDIFLPPKGTQKGHISALRRDKTGHFRHQTGLFCT